MRPLVDHVNSTWAKVAVLLIGVLAVLLWMWAFPAQGAVASTSGCNYNRASQYGPVSSSCDSGSSEMNRTMVGVECTGAGLIGGAFGGWKGGVGAGLGCTWAKLF